MNIDRLHAIYALCRFANGSEGCFCHRTHDQVGGLHCCEETSRALRSCLPPSISEAEIDALFAGEAQVVLRKPKGGAKSKVTS
ncbi:MAG: hypothetical protein KDA49_18820 [Rhodospirillaceae bacterium]|nr:hypothetical protein [Rhodospirillaceae bacterium]